MNQPRMLHSAGGGAPSPARTQIRVSAAVATAINRRPANEDVIGIGGWVLHGNEVNPIETTLLTGGVKAPHVLVAVADGMSGAPAGERAARVAADTLTRRRDTGTADESAIREAFLDADRAIHAIAEADPHCAGMGCTAALVVVRSDGVALVANVGDVRVYRTVEGHAGQVTVDDRAAEETVTSCLGGLSGLHRDDPHVSEFAIRHGDRFVLCSDGLFDSVEVSELIRSTAGRGVAFAAADLIKAAKAAPYSADNLTVVVLEIVVDGEARPSTVRPAPYVVNRQPPDDHGPHQPAPAWYVQEPDQPRRRFLWLSGVRARRPGRRSRS